MVLAGADVSTGFFMSKNWYKFMKTLIFILASLASVAANANKCLPVESLIVLDSKYEEAMRMGDAAFFKNLLADNYVWVHNLAASIDTKETILVKAKNPAEIPKARTTSDVQGHVLHNTVVLRGLSSVDKWNPDGKTWRTSRYQFMRTYVNTGKTCKLLSVQTMKVWSSDGQ
jgi:hypothetical protein